MPHNRLLLGTKDSAARASMFKQTNLTLARAFDICTIAEISQDQLEQIGSKKSMSQNITSNNHKNNKEGLNSHLGIRNANIVDRAIYLTRQSVLHLGKCVQPVANKILLLQYACRNSV